ncbi:LTA synthase family protein [Anaeromicrobium sediminis]|uniref:Sulfatase N-terminal domain-containing protein n=1 Tax=Anaeromicrobium sediminis TaxID=1478221 RepID=A0A267MQS0_9FIRM|nr:LTA synthase family protein [Anaeromicrobium sediminis]PAB61123.1 hypothetical protein CCE28_01470 [Anaeromicrobium sediminis]
MLRGIRQFKLNIYLSLIILFLVSLILTCVAFILQPNSITEILECIEKNPIIVLYNFFPILLGELFIFFLLGSISISILSTSWIIILSSIINQYKILIRQEPFLPADLGLYKEAIMSIKAFQYNMGLEYRMVIIGIILSILIALLIRTYKLKLYIRVSGVIITLLCVFILNQIVYSDTQLYYSLYIKGTDCSQVNHYNSKGFVYCFWYFINSNKIEKPNGYSLKKAEELLNDYKNIENKANRRAVNVILIMGEAFSDICNNKNLRFEGYTYPLENFEKLKKDGLSGYIITPNFGGGTANTEFDVLTGLCTKYINENASSFWYIRKPMDSLVNDFKKKGYKTMAIHPGDLWFYNRQNVYKHLGFDEFIHKAYFDQNAVKGYYISEKATIDKVIDTYREHQRNSKNPIFIHCVTIQNHYAYKKKYYGITQNFNTDKLLNKDEINMVSNYFEGLKDADFELKRLTDNLNLSNEPVVLMYFGDHLPSFGRGLDLYKKLGYPMDINGTIEERHNMNKVPFLIWQNKAYKEIVNLQENMDDMHIFDGMVINANYLGGILLELMGFENASPIFEYSNKLCNDLPVMTRSNHFKTSSGYTEYLSEELEEKLLKYKIMQYYLLTE